MLDPRIGRGSTWDSSSISRYTLLQTHGEMNIQFPEMLFFVAEPEVVVPDLSELDRLRKTNSVTRG